MRSPMNVALSLPLLIGLIAVALAFDFLNGLHDAANSIATIVSTRVLRPQYAVAWAAFFNFIAFLFFGLHVANTLGTGIIDAAAIDAARRVRRADGRDPVEPDHLGPRHPVELARTRWSAAWSAPAMAKAGAVGDRLARSRSDHGWRSSLRR